MTSATPQKEKLIIFDTTLRDGEQSPGASLHAKEKLLIAQQLCRLGVDVCEAGFPIASPGDFEAVELVAKEVGPMEVEGRAQPMRIAGLARATEKDIDRAYQAVRHAPLHRIHTFLATSDIHLQYKLKISREECIRRSVEAVKFARERVDDVEFSAEDAGRSDPEFLSQIMGEVIAAGATTLNIPDTVGFTTPEEYGALIRFLIENTPGAEKAIWSVHCHNDLGLAVANTLNAVSAGARQAEVTINGIGERAGNTSLEEVVMTLQTRPKSYPVYTNILSKQLMRTSRMVSNFTGMTVQPNKAIVGKNAFAHEAGIHQDGILKHAATYEIMKPESVGLTSSLVMGKHSGQHAFKARLAEIGFEDVCKDDDMCQKAFEKFKVVADRKKEVTDADIEAIISDQLVQPEELWHLNAINVASGTNSLPMASVSLRSPTGEDFKDAAGGGGPIEAIYKALSRVCGVNIALVDFQIKSVTEGDDAVGNVTVRIKNLDETSDSGSDSSSFEEFEEITYGGHSAHVDTLRATAEAIVGAINQMLSAKKIRKRLIPPGRVMVQPQDQEADEHMRNSLGMP